MTLDNWNDYTGKSWLSVDEVKDENQAFVVVGVDISEEDKRPVLQLQSNGLIAFFQLNVTNSNKCKEYVNSPNAMIGKKVYFKKALVTSPKTKKEVDTLRICKVE